MRFQVPQFIGVEDKIFGPLTIKQFIYLAGGAGMIFVIARIFPAFIALILGAVVGMFALALTFYSVNDRPFIIVLESAVRYWFGKKLYLWKKDVRAPQISKESQDILQDPLLYVPKMSNSRLKDLNWQIEAKNNNAVK